MNFNLKLIFFSYVIVIAAEFSILRNFLLEEWGKDARYTFDLYISDCNNSNDGIFVINIKLSSNIFSWSLLYLSKP